MLAASLACCGCWLRVLAESRQLMGVMLVFIARASTPQSQGVCVQKKRQLSKNHVGRLMSAFTTCMGHGLQGRHLVEDIAAS